MANYQKIESVLRSKVGGSFKKERIVTMKFRTLEGEFLLRNGRLVFADVQSNVRVFGVVLLWGSRRKFSSDSNESPATVEEFMKFILSFVSRAHVIA